MEQCAHAAGETPELLAVLAVHIEARQPRQHLARERGRRWCKVRVQCVRRGHGGREGVGRATVGANIAWVLGAATDDGTGGTRGMVGGGDLHEAEVAVL